MYAAIVHIPYSTIFAGYRTACVAKYTYLALQSKIAPERREKDSLISNSNVQPRRSIIQVRSHGILKRSSVILNPEQVKEDFHFRRHIWLQQNTTNAKRFRAEVDDAIELPSRFVGTICNAPGCGILQVLVCL